MEGQGVCHFSHTSSICGLRGVSRPPRGGFILGPVKFFFLMLVVSLMRAHSHTRHLPDFWEFSSSRIPLEIWREDKPRRIFCYPQIRLVSRNNEVDSFSSVT